MQIVCYSFWLLSLLELLLLLCCTFTSCKSSCFPGDIYDMIQRYRRHMEQQKKWNQPLFSYLLRNIQSGFLASSPERTDDDSSRETLEWQVKWLSRGLSAPRWFSSTYGNSNVNVNLNVFLWQDGLDIIRGSITWSCWVGWKCRPRGCRQGFVFSWNWSSRLFSAIKK